MRESYITQYPLIFPRPLVSFHSRLAAEPHAAQVACGGYCSRLHAVQFCTIRRRSLHASQNGLLTSSGTGIGFGMAHSAAIFVEKGRSRTSQRCAFQVSSELG